MSKHCETSTHQDATIAFLQKHGIFQELSEFDDNYDEFDDNYDDDDYNVDDDNGGDDDDDDNDGDDDDDNNNDDHDHDHGDDNNDNNDDGNGDDNSNNIPQIDENMMDVDQNANEEREPTENSGMNTKEMEELLDYISRGNQEPIPEESHKKIINLAFITLWMSQFKISKKAWHCLCKFLRHSDFCIDFWKHDCSETPLFGVKKKKEGKTHSNYLLLSITLLSLSDRWKV